MEISGNTGGASLISSIDKDEEVDPILVNEIESYIQTVAEQEQTLIDMSDSPLGSGGARCVAKAIMSCKQLHEIQL